ncbi:hypothetical protein EK904_014305 [Melospiza melodia maxima]|nr:hypothetical protein EK904_014305 [Melospiza melodia maxima]
MPKYFTCNIEGHINMLWTWAKGVKKAKLKYKKTINPTIKLGYVKYSILQSYNVLNVLKICFKGMALLSVFNFPSSKTEKLIVIFSYLSLVLRKWLDFSAFFRELDGCLCLCPSSACPVLLSCCSWHNFAVAPLVHSDPCVSHGSEQPGHCTLGIPHFSAYCFHALLSFSTKLILRSCISFHFMPSCVFVSAKGFSPEDECSPVQKFFCKKPYQIFNPFFHIEDQRYVFSKIKIFKSFHLPISMLLGQQLWMLYKSRQIHFCCPIHGKLHVLSLWDSRNSPDLYLLSAVLVPYHKLNLGRSFTLSFSALPYSPSPTHCPCSFLSLLGIHKRNLLLSFIMVYLPALKAVLFQTIEILLQTMDYFPVHEMETYQKKSCLKAFYCFNSVFLKPFCKSPESVLCVTDALMLSKLPVCNLCWQCLTSALCRISVRQEASNFLEEIFVGRDDPFRDPSSRSGNLTILRVLCLAKETREHLRVHRCDSDVAAESESHRGNLLEQHRQSTPSAALFQDGKFSNGGGGAGSSSTHKSTLKPSLTVAAPLVWRAAASEGSLEQGRPFPGASSVSCSCHRAQCAVPWPQCHPWASRGSGEAPASEAEQAPCTEPWQNTC